MSIDKKLVEETLATIRPRLQADGGDIALKEIQEDGTVLVELQGACRGCPMAGLTMASQVECVLKENVPGVTKVVNASAM
ncbi:MAG: NifU family protein [Coriobacteriia bacterium]|nr:NifU family protein [Coriobacteriia bacterium]MCL2745536.1 NifU family protein [Coriobacteriia bacterium]MCL2870838.1 NifU family protein [Coriobacteriia bacterium]